MTSRPTLIRSIPFWILLVGSLALTAVGAWLVFSRLGGLEDGLRNQTADQGQQLELGIASYIAPPVATAGAIVLGAGLVGLLLTLALAAAASVFTRPVEIVEAIDWSDDDETAPDSASFDDVVPAAPATSVDAEPAASPVPAAAAEPAAHGDPVISGPVVSEDPDVEVPSDKPAPPAADR
jgi:hypothetical protein